MRILLFVSVLFVFSITNAQEVKFGVHIDPQMCWMLPESRDVNSTGKVFGINGGLIIDKYFQKNYAFSTGISLGNQGGKLKYEYELPLKVYDEVDTLPAGSELDYKLQYITIPMGLKLKSNQIGYATIFVNLGFTNQLNINAKASSDNENGLEGDSIKDEIAWFNMGYHFGGGVEYALGEDTAILLGVLYHNGFLDQTKFGPRTNSRVLSLRFGIVF